MTQNAMNLRNVTIWTTGVMMAGTFVFSAGYNVTLIISISGIGYLSHGITRALLLWCISASPFAVSYFTVKKLAYRFPIVIIFLPTIACTIVYIFVLYYVLFVEHAAGLLFSIVAILFLPMMIVARIIALLLNSRYAKNSSPPETEVASSFPTLFLVVAILFFPVIVPAWIIVVLLKRHHAKKTSSPETSAAPLAPALLENENKVQ